MSIYQNGMKLNNVVGNITESDNDAGYKAEVSEIFNSYAAEGIELTRDFGNVISDPTSRQQFVDTVLESVTTSPVFTNQACTNDPFYGNYNERVGQLVENSMKQIATESAMIGYAPIVAYNPFFLKKQWIDCIFKDVLMTEIPKTPVIEIGYERRWLKDLEGNEYPLPEALYDDNLLRKLMDAATGLNLSEDPIDLATVKNLYLIDPKYIPGVTANDISVELTHNIYICKVYMKGTDGTEYEVPTNIGIDISTHNFVKGHVHYTVLDTDGEVSEELEDDLYGMINFRESKITVMGTTGVVTKICLRGKIANRFNQRALTTERRVEKIEKTMPESGPRLDTAITIEDAADALALQNIDLIADNINIMGATLANLEDGEIKLFLADSADAQLKGQQLGLVYNELDNSPMIEVSRFNTLPYEQYAGNVTTWMKDAREYFERLIGALKQKLRTQNLMLVAVCNPNLVRFLQDGINWVFSDDTSVSGVKLSYNFGIYTGSSDRVHIVTTQRLKEDDGIRVIGIPLTQELMTYKHYKYNMVIDRGYRNPMYTLTPNLMATHRTLTFEIFPMQGLMYIDGREMFSPSTLVRPTAGAGTGDAGGDTP